MTNAPLFDLALIAPPEDASSRASVQLGEMLVAAVNDTLAPASG